MFAEVNGTKIYFDVDGEGLTPDGPEMREKPTIVLAHGGPGADHSIAKPFFSQLTDIAQIIYYDHRGNGRSDPDRKENWTLAQWSEDLKGLCDALGIRKPIVVGTSFGGFVTQSYAIRYPGHAAGLVLISTAAKMDFPAVYDAFERRGGNDIREIAQAYWDDPTDQSRDLYKKRCVPFYSATDGKSPDWLTRVLWRNEPALWFNGPHNEHGRFDYREELKKIKCPVLVMAGEEDPITPPEFSDTLVECLNAAPVSYAKYPQCGHGVIGDKPNEALADLRRFISKIAAS